MKQIRRVLITVVLIVGTAKVLPFVSSLLLLCSSSVLFCYVFYSFNVDSLPSIFIVFIFVQFTAAYDTSSLSVEEYIIENLMNFESEIDLFAYLDVFGSVYNENISNDVAKKFQAVLLLNPQIFFVKIANRSVQCWTSKSDETKIETITKISVFDFAYNMTKVEYSTAVEDLDKEVAKVLKYAQHCRNDMEKALAVHDYIVLNTTYNSAEKKYLDKYGKPNNDFPHTAYGALVQKSAVCGGFSQAYAYILRKLGIDCTLVTSEEMSHRWNYVKVDGKWYHVDTTWDEQHIDGNKVHGSVCHSNFLLSDEAIMKTNHYNWMVEGEGYPAATSKTYDNFFWKTIESAVVKLGDYLYWIERDLTSPACNRNYLSLQGTMSIQEYNNTFFRMYSNLKSFNLATQKTSNVYQIDSTWFLNGSESTRTKTWARETYARLAVYNGKIYFNTTKQINSYDPVTKKVAIVSSPTFFGCYIYGMTMSSNKITYTLKTKPSDVDSFKTKTLTACDSSKVVLNKFSASITIGGTVTLKATLTPAESTDYVYWVSSKPTVATVSESGVVCGHKVGSTIITAYTETDKKATCKITICSQ